MNDKQQDLSPTNSVHSAGAGEGDDEDPDPSIYEAQPSTYWSGRWVSLNDAILNDIDGEVPLPSLEKDNKLMVAYKEVDRAKTVFKALEACCRTRAAKRSLWVGAILARTCLLAANAIRRPFKYGSQKYARCQKSSWTFLRTHVNKLCSLF